MEKTEFIGGCFWTIIGSVIIHQSLSLEYWLPMGPGPGFMPIWSGILVLIGGLLLIGSAYSKSKTGEKVHPVSAKEGNLLLLGGVLVIIVIFVYLMESLGFALSMFALLFTLIMLTRKHSKKTAAVISLLVVSGFYFLFSLCLRIPLPEFFIEF